MGVIEEEVQCFRMNLREPGEQMSRNVCIAGDLNVPGSELTIGAQAALVLSRSANNLYR